MTWLFEKNISLAAAGNAYLRALYHIYAQFDTGGTWENFAQIIDVSDATHFTGETAVQSGDWFVVRFSNLISNQTIEAFFGGVTAAGVLGPYSPSAAGLYISVGFTGGWISTIGFTNDSGILLLSATVTEPWELHFLTQTDRCCFIILGATEGTTNPEVLDLGVYIGRYIAADTEDDYPSVLLVGDPTGAAANRWNDLAVVAGKSYEASKNVMVGVNLEYVTDGTMLGKDGNNLLREITLHSVISGGNSIGMLGNMEGIYQCRNSGITDGDTGTFDGTTYLNSRYIAVIWS
jgi:hypothetical protein